MRQTNVRVDVLQKETKEDAIGNTAIVTSKDLGAAEWAVGSSYEVD